MAFNSKTLLSLLLFSALTILASAQPRDFRFLDPNYTPVGQSTSEESTTEDDRTLSTNLAKANAAEQIDLINSITNLNTAPNMGLVQRAIAQRALAEDTSAWHDPKNLPGILGKMKLNYIWQNVQPALWTIATLLFTLTIFAQVRKGALDYMDLLFRMSTFLLIMGGANLIFHYLIDIQQALPGMIMDKIGTAPDATTRMKTDSVFAQARTETVKALAHYTNLQTITQLDLRPPVPAPADGAVPPPPTAGQRGGPAGRRAVTYTELVADLLFVGTTGGTDTITKAAPGSMKYSGSFRGLNNAVNASATSPITRTGSKTWLDGMESEGPFAMTVADFKMAIARKNTVPLYAQIKFPVTAETYTAGKPDEALMTGLNSILLFLSSWTDVNGKPKSQIARLYRDRIEDLSRASSSEPEEDANFIRKVRQAYIYEIGRLGILPKTITAVLTASGDTANIHYYIGSSNGSENDADTLDKVTLDPPTQSTSGVSQKAAYLLYSARTIATYGMIQTPVSISQAPMLTMDDVDAALTGSGATSATGGGKNAGEVASYNSNNAGVTGWGVTAALHRFITTLFEDFNRMVSKGVLILFAFIYKIIFIIQFFIVLLVAPTVLSNTLDVAFKGQIKNLIYITITPAVGGFALGMWSMFMGAITSGSLGMLISPVSSPGGDAVAGTAAALALTYSLGSISQGFVVGIIICNIVGTVMIAFKVKKWTQDVLSGASIAGDMLKTGVTALAAGAVGGIAIAAAPFLAPAAGAGSAASIKAGAAKGLAGAKKGMEAVGAVSDAAMSGDTSHLGKLAPQSPQEKASPNSPKDKGTQVTAGSPGHKPTGGLKLGVATTPEERAAVTSAHASLAETPEYRNASQGERNKMVANQLVKNGTTAERAAAIAPSHAKTDNAELGFANTPKRSIGQKLADGAKDFGVGLVSPKSYSAESRMERTRALGRGAADVAGGLAGWVQKQAKVATGRNEDGTDNEKAGGFSRFARKSSNAVGTLAGAMGCPTSMDQAVHIAKTVAVTVGVATQGLGQLKQIMNVAEGKMVYDKIKNADATEEMPTSPTMQRFGGGGGGGGGAQGNEILERLARIEAQSKRNG